MNENTQDKEMLKRIEREVRMREGASKLLAACSQREQALEASKSLLTCNARILALLSQLQKMRKAQILRRVGRRSSEVMVPCTGKIALSESSQVSAALDETCRGLSGAQKLNLRIPLMWKDSEYFKNKGELHRCAVFCLLHCDAEIFDTDLVMVDRTLTDICFEETFMFSEVAPDFQLRVELYSSCVVEDFSPVTAGPRRGSCLGGYPGFSSGKKILAALESATVCGSTSSGEDTCSGNVTLPDLSTLGSKYNLLAHTTLRIEHVQESFKTHDLSLATEEDCPFWLPLYGNICCRLIAQPLCMTHPILSGQLKVQLEGNLKCWENVHGVIRGQSLLCYQSQDGLNSEDEPVLVIPIKKNTVVRALESDAVHMERILITAQCLRENVSYTLIPHISEETQRWTEALWQHIYNISQWKQCCNHLMKIEMPSPRKCTTVKQGLLYHEIVIDDPSTVELECEKLFHMVTMPG